MDFGTMNTKLTQGKYSTMEDFARDVELVFSNCRKFNPEHTYPYVCADTVERVWKKEWARAMEKKLSYAEKRSLQGLMKTLATEHVCVSASLSFAMTHPHASNTRSSWVFREAVDPVALGIPTYFDIIPKKDARDLRMIQQKLNGDKYDSVEAFEADLDLMIHNAITFNGADSEVGQLAVQTRNRYRDLLSPIRGTNGKRKGGEKGTPQPAKKAKLG